MERIPIRGYEGLYSIDEFGNIYRHFKHTTVIMKPSVKPRGHLEIRLLNKAGRRRTYNVARLVAIHFLPKPYMADSVIHKNGNKQCPHVDNLAWVSKRQLGLRYGHRVEKAMQICKADKNGEVVEVYHSAREAARKNYMSYQTILNRVNGKVKGRYAPDGYEYFLDER